jgi:hypothetical protein
MVQSFALRMPIRSDKIIVIRNATTTLAPKGRVLAASNSRITCTRRRATAPPWNAALVQAAARAPSDVQSTARSYGRVLLFSSLLEHPQWNPRSKTLQSAEIAFVRRVRRRNRWITKEVGPRGHDPRRASATSTKSGAFPGLGHLTDNASCWASKREGLRYEAKHGSQNRKRPYYTSGAEF